jgi:hypothetical protein
MNYRLFAEAGHLTLAGGESHATLGAPYTGRKVDVESAYAPARAWLEQCTLSSFEHAECDERFRQALVEAIGVRFGHPLFRGRFFNHPPASAREFGPPPPPHARESRYNRDGKRALYLCTSSLGVLKEMEPQPGEELWIQRFSNVASLLLFDARPLPQTSFTAGVFWVVEQQRDRTQETPALGARIGELVAERFDGMIVPGVRGSAEDRDSPEVRYSNVVIFRLLDHWHDFLDQYETPWRAT